MKHVNRWGAVYVLLLLFIGSWVGQGVTMIAETGPFKPMEFWAATFENWQSEFLQLAIQCLLVQSLWASRHLFAAEGAADKDDVDKILVAISQIKRGEE